MATFRQIEANRRNALASSGPRTREGKARARQNALRHGLASIERDSVLSGEVVERAKEILGNREPSRMKFAVIVAESILELRRIYATKTSIINLLDAEEAGVEAKTADVIDGRMPAKNEIVPVAELQQKEESRPPSPVAVMRAIPDLLRLDRYEQRAISRQKRAIRNLDNP